MSSLRAAAALVVVVIATGSCLMLHGGCDQKEQLRIGHIVMGERCK